MVNGQVVTDERIHLDIGILEALSVGEGGKRGGIPRVPRVPRYVPTELRIILLSLS